MILSTVLRQIGILADHTLAIIKKDGLVLCLFLVLPEGQDSYKDTQPSLQYSFLSSQMPLPFLAITLSPCYCGVRYSAFNITIKMAHGGQ